MQRVEIDLCRKKESALSYLIIKSQERNTKSEIRPILSYGGSFPSHLVRTVKLRVRISSVTDAAALRRG